MSDHCRETSRGMKAAGRETAESRFFLRSWSRNALKRAAKKAPPREYSTLRRWSTARLFRQLQRDRGHDHEHPFIQPVDFQNTFLFVSESDEGPCRPGETSAADLNAIARQKPITRPSARPRLKEIVVSQKTVPQVRSFLSWQHPPRKATCFSRKFMRPFV